MTDRIPIALHRGLDFLAEDFSFIGNCCADQTGLNRRVFFPIPFILTSLAFLKGDNYPAWRKIREQGLACIGSAAGADGAFNYLLPSADAPSNKIYPDDLDDTALAYAALLIHTGGLSGRQLASFTQLLIRAETAPGGPYNTWLTDWQKNTRWQDIDPAVNSNIAFALSLAGVRLPCLRSYLERCISKNTLYSDYYPPLAVSYFLSRAYEGPARQQAIAAIRAQQQNGRWPSPLATALALSALCRWKSAKGLRKAAEYLRETQQADGSWEAEGLYIETGTAQKKAWYGSRALTTAVCLEALDLICQHQSRRPLITVPALAETANDQALVRGMTEYFINECRSANYEWAVLAQEAGQRFTTHPFWREALLWARRAAEAISPEIPIDDRTFCSLGTTQLFGLTAYAILDDIVDRQSSTGALPFAVFAVRRCAAHFERLWPGGQSERILSGIERALSEEAAGRLSRDTAAKSLGCTLPALAIAALSGKSRSQLASFEGYFRALLAARQWNDDAYDYIEDIAAGRLTPVTDLLETARQAFPGKEGPRLSDMPPLQLRRLFWEAAFPDICRRITACLKKADTALRQAALRQPLYFQGLIDRQAATLHTVQDERQRTIDFLASYSAAGEKQKAG